MFSPDPALRSAKRSPSRPDAIKWRKLAKAASAIETLNRNSSWRSQVAEFWRTGAPKQEQLFLGGCLSMWWLFDAASLSGYAILALFIAVALGRLAKSSIHVLAKRLPRRSRSRHYVIAFTSAAFFSLLTARGCYLAAVIVDSQFRSDPFQIYGNKR
ncbi:hypothetical protein DXM27_24765 [Rhizobium rhizogenes]|uniref:Uncharacterized protein n=1 Tax=Rhizobium rhizogenes TaxID=359 RepID=A0AA88JNV2_RHIRH|nr:hypothetical protein DXM27_24765 [Rhizobium rhizogenes]KAA3521766.1 hypothetical protein DXM29_23875 [Agrobacterium tumefaciens]